MIGWPRRESLKRTESRRRVDGTGRSSTSACLTPRIFGSWSASQDKRHVLFSANTSARRRLASEARGREHRAHGFLRIFSRMPTPLSLFGNLLGNLDFSPKNAPPSRHAPARTDYCAENADRHRLRELAALFLA